MWDTIKVVIFLFIAGALLSILGLWSIGVFFFAAIPLAIIGYIASNGSISAGIFFVAVLFFELGLIFKNGILSTIGYVFLVIFVISLIIKLFRGLFL